MLRIAQEALTFDDVLLQPSYSDVLPKDVCLKTRLTRAIELNIPLLSAAMDTVTEMHLAVAMAQLGGLGIIHKNMTAAEQAAQVLAVKRYEAGVVKSPITIDAQATVEQLLMLRKQHCISGVPVMDQGRLVGIITSRDVRFEQNIQQPVAHLMTPRDRLVTVLEGTSQKQVQKLLQQHRIEKILVVNHQGDLTGMMTVKDMQKAQDFPLASKDDQGRLRVGAAVGTGEGTEERAHALIEAGVDVIVVDTAHGHSKGVLDRVAWMKQQYPNVQVIGGNIATAAAALALADAGVDGVKVGIGPGSICTTRIVTGIGVPQLTAISNVTQALAEKGHDIPVIADGGVRFSGDLGKAIAAGAHSVMMGSVLAGTEEAPGEVELYQGRSYKAYRGMGSLGAMAQVTGSSDRYFQDAKAGSEKLVPEGIEGRVPYKGPLAAVLHQMMGGLRATMGYTGSANIHTLRTQACFVTITAAGVQESHVHDVSITKEAPNYRMRS